MPWEEGDDKERGDFPLGWSLKGGKCSSSASPISHRKMAGGFFNHVGSHHQIGTDKVKKGISLTIEVEIMELIEHEHERELVHTHE